MQPLSLFRNLAGVDRLGPKPVLQRKSGRINSAPRIIDGNGVQAVAEMKDRAVVARVVPTGPAFQSQFGEAFAQPLWQLDIRTVPIEFHNPVRLAQAGWRP